MTGTPILSYGPRVNKVEGNLAYDRVRGFEESRAAEGAVQFGRIVTAGTTDDQCIEGGDGIPLGMALRDHGQGMDEDSEGQYDDESMVSIIDKDYVIISTVSTLGAYRDVVYYDESDGTIVVTDAPSATQHPIGYLAQTLTAAGLAKVYIDADTIKDVTPPSEVTSLALTPGDTEIAVAWTDPTEGDLARVDVFCFVHATGLFVTKYELDPDDEAVTITGLTNSVEYRVTVRTVDESGNVSYGVSDTETPSA